MIKPSHFYQHLADLGKLNLLYGQQPPSVLPEFWKRFEEVEPNNPVHAAFASGNMDAAKTIPMYIHGDEGRGKKRLPVMIVNTHGVIGAGCRAFEDYHKDAPTMRKNAMPVNIKGHSAETRFLSFVLSKKAYGEDSEYLRKLFDALVSDLELMQQKGVQIQGETWKFAFIGTVGDLQFFTKIGGLTRSYNHVSKKSGQQMKAGICHLCQAGLPGWPFEHFLDSPTWLQSVGTVDPWENPPSMVLRLFANPDNLASNNVQDRFTYFDEFAQAYLQRTGKTLYCKRINEVTLGFDSFQKCPQGGWQKASDTTIILEIFEAFCDGHTAKSAQEPILAWTHTAVANLNACLRLLYRCGLWMTQQQAAEAACCGLNFLKSYGHLVHLTILANRDRFPLTPKMHYIHHLMVDMQTQSASAAWSLNCVASTVQMDEDFVGWNARASRRVGAQHMSLRCLQRYLLQAAERITPEYLRWKPDASERARACLAKRSIAESHFIANLIQASIIIQ
eukprot:s1493_g3.t1